MTYESCLILILTVALGINTYFTFKHYQNNSTLSDILHTLRLIHAAVERDIEKEVKASTELERSKMNFERTNNLVSRWLFNMDRDNATVDELIEAYGKFNKLICEIENQDSKK